MAVNVVHTRQDLLYLLSVAAELEHSLTCQYLYAAWSLKERGDDKTITEDQYREIQTWSDALTRVAIQEMAHLAFATNLLQAIGGAPYLYRANFPQQKTYTSLSLQFQLAPFNEDTIKRFICFELPDYLKSDEHNPYFEWVKQCKCIKEHETRLRLFVQDLLPGTFKFESIGQLYEIIAAGFRNLYRDHPSQLFIGDFKSQVSGILGVFPVVDRISAANAIEEIVSQGEGGCLPGSGTIRIEDSHFGQFVNVFHRFKEGKGGEFPAWKAISNPMYAPHHDVEVQWDKQKLRPTLVTNKIARKANQIFISSYELMLLILSRYFAQSGETVAQANALQLAFRQLMSDIIEPLGRGIFTLPNTPEEDGIRSGPSFELYYPVALLPQIKSAWTFFITRLQEIEAFASALLLSEGVSNYPKFASSLQKVQVGILSIKKDLESALNPPTQAPNWEEIATFFTAIDIDHMKKVGRNAISLDDYNDVKTNAPAIYKACKAKTMPPPGTGDPWTDEMLSKFKAWMDAGYPSKAGVSTDTTYYWYPTKETKGVKDLFSKDNITILNERGINAKSYYDVITQKHLDSITLLIFNNAKDWGWDDESLKIWRSWFARHPEGVTWWNEIFFLFNHPETVRSMKHQYNIDVTNYDDVIKHLPFIKEKIQFNELPGRVWSTEMKANFASWEKLGLPVGEQRSSKPKMGWKMTNAPKASSRYDDIWFTSPDEGWAVNSSGEILHTADGGDSWEIQFITQRKTYLRCCGFANSKVGWVGTLGNNGPLMYSTVDGGVNWSVVDSRLPDPSLRPMRICGLSVVDENVVWASGTNYPTDKTPRVIRTLDGGNSWAAIDLSYVASNLIDCKFFDKNTGWVVGGFTTDPNPTFDNVHPVVLKTEDGGLTWVNKIEGLPGIKDGEWGWKLDFVTSNEEWPNQHIFVSVENESYTLAGSILRSDDGGEHWVRYEINDVQYSGYPNSNLEGIGFLNLNHGIVGGWGDKSFSGGYTSQTFDGGRNWEPANYIGRFLNRFRFFRHTATADPFLGYASGDNIYKYTQVDDDTVGSPVRHTDKQLVIIKGPFKYSVAIPPDVNQAHISMFNRFGVLYVDKQVWTRTNQLGDVTFEWEYDGDKQLTPGQYILRIQLGDDRRFSQNVQFDV